MVIQANQYKIITDDTWSASLNRFLQQHPPSSCFILCDENTLQHCLPSLITSCPLLAEAEIIEVEAGEQSKSLEIAAQIWHTLSEAQADRDMLLINLGGGVVTDLGGFCASVYKRGVNFINVPTSLLAMADASVGAKNGIDFAGIKNMIGTFTEPVAVFVNPHFLRTLPQNQIMSGLAEVYKIALVSDRRFWSKLIKQNSQDLPAHISASIVLKNKIVKKDPLDKGLRKILNFGHTAGHALESASFLCNKPLLHGEAVLAGMLMESHLSWQKKMIGKKTLDLITGAFMENFTLPDISLINEADFFRLLQNDKKNKNKQLLFSLLNDIGSCKTNVEVKEPLIKKAFDYYKRQAHDQD